MKRWAVGFAVLVVLGGVGRAEAAISFTTVAVFGVGPLTWGNGEWTIERAPLGSGIPLSEPANLTDGFAIRDFVFRYVVGSGDISGGVGIAWSAMREFEAVSGNFTNTIRLGFTVELAVTQGNSVWVQWEANTLHQLVSPSGQALVYGGDWLSPSDPLSVFVESSTSFFNPMSSGTDYLEQSIGIYLHPTQAGQEFLIHLSPDVGVTATTTETAGPNPGAIPEPTTLIIWSLLGGLAISVGWWRRTRAA